MITQPTSPSPPSLQQIRDFWERQPIGDAAITARTTWYDYFRAFDDLREAPDVEPYSFSNEIHGYEDADRQKVLDYGCGNGYVLAQYARNGAEVSGVDITDAAIELSQQRFRLLELTGTFVRADGNSIPFESETFDTACSMGVLHHIPDPTQIVEELYRVLKPGGKLVIMLYYRHSFRYHVTFRWRRRFGPPKYRGREIQELLNMNDGGENPWGDVYSRAETRKLLASFERHTFFVNKLGADELTQWSSSRAAKVTASIAGRTVLRPLARRFGWNLYCVAYKP